MGLSEFVRWFFHIDFSDWTNYIALLIAIFLLWWGIKTIVMTLTLAPTG
jgi:hypothetical protein